MSARAQDRRRRPMARRVGGRTRPAPSSPLPLNVPFCPLRVPSAPPSIPLCRDLSPSPLPPHTHQLCLLGPPPSLPPPLHSLSFCLPPGFRCLRPTLGLGVGHLTRLLDKGLSCGPGEARDPSSQTPGAGRARDGPDKEARAPSSVFLLSNREQVNSLQGAGEVSQEAKEE